MAALFETMRLDCGQFVRERYHRDRLARSCQALGYPFDAERWHETLKMIAAQYSDIAYRVRVEWHATGEVTHTIAPLPNKEKFTAQLCLQMPNVPTWKVINKTTARDFLAHDHETDVVLFYDASGKILEFDIGNVVIKTGDTYVTPKYNDDFLRGCMRQAMIDEGQLVEKDIDVATFISQLKRGEIEVFMINSLRGLVAVQFYL